MTKPKSAPRRDRKGRPAFPLLDIFIRFEASRRMTGMSVNAHCKAIEFYLVGGHLPEESFSRVTGEALRRHIQIFRRDVWNTMGPVMQAAVEKRIVAEVHLLTHQ